MFCLTEDLIDMKLLLLHEDLKRMVYARLKNMRIRLIEFRVGSNDR